MESARRERLARVPKSKKSRERNVAPPLCQRFGVSTRRWSARAFAENGRESCEARARRCPRRKRHADSLTSRATGKPHARGAFARVSDRAKKNHVMVRAGVTRHAPSLS